MDSLVIANLFLLLFLGLADNQMIAALLPSLVKSLGISLSTAGLLVVVYSLAAAVAAFFSGTLSDHYGRRRFLLAGVALFAVASFAASRTRTLNELMLARALTGLAAGTLSTCSITFAADWFAYNVRGRAIGLISSAYFAAPILGVPIAAQIADRYGWRRAFLFFAGLAVATAFATLRLPRERLSASEVQSPKSEVQNPSSGSSLAASDLGPRTSDSKLRSTVHTFRSFLERRDTLAALVSFLTYIGQWLNSTFALPTRTIGWVFMLGGIVAVGSAPLGGILSDRWGKRAISIASNIVLAVAVAFVPFLPWGWGLLGVFALASLGAAFRQGPLTALMTEMVPAAQRGSFIALRNISSQMGIGATAYLGGVLFQRSGYAAVTTLCAVMTAAVVVLLATHIVEPRGADVSAPGQGA
jgi:DHA1 family purine base/nucleoside efflux pump-like MFS transporter